MKTDELIADLSCNPPRRPSLGPSATVVVAALLSLVVVLALSILWHNPRPDLAISLIVENHAFLLKLAFSFSVVAGALSVVQDLSVPGRRIGWRSIFIAMPFLVILALVPRELVHHHHVGELSSHVQHALFECLWQIPALAVPAFVILAIAVRRLAPTNLTGSGAYVGLLAGGIGAVGHALDCQDDTLVFVTIAYTLAIAESGLLGALVGPRVLRWR